MSNWRIWLINKLIGDKSYMKNIRINGDVFMLKNTSYLYGCEFNGRIYASDGREFAIPIGKFKYRRIEMQKQENAL